MADPLYDGEAVLASGWTAVILECSEYWKMESPRTATTILMPFLSPTAIPLLSCSHNPCVGGSSSHMDYKWDVIGKVKVSKSYA